MVLRVVNTILLVRRGRSECYPWESQRVLLSTHDTAPSLPGPGAGSGWRATPWRLAVISSVVRDLVEASLISLARRDRCDATWWRPFVVVLSRGVTSGQLRGSSASRPYTRAPRLRDSPRPFVVRSRSKTGQSALTCWVVVDPCDDVVTVYLSLYCWCSPFRGLTRRRRFHAVVVGRQDLFVRPAGSLGWPVRF